MQLFFKRDVCMTDSMIAELRLESTVQQNTVWYIETRGLEVSRFDCVLPALLPWPQQLPATPPCHNCGYSHMLLLKRKKLDSSK
ncbi:hypothetical protein J1614_004520 [Plenodomus biglobosus]|nr:hypothetical protein J1614_004520 [Plenodomus biglobosus]